ncbi:hypothetical protein [Pontibacter sp. H249]|uniref:hypothetical protein n=1 Tax=Pontibacter sp. H249 TaxID=3133420 RepID=UPI0030BE7630
MKYTTNQEIELDITPYEVARLFCNMDGDEQAQFFSEIGEITVREWAAPFCIQMATVEGSNFLQDKGRDVMKTIGEYSEKQ